MGVSGFMAFASVIGTIAQSSSASRARRSAEAQSALEREALAELKAEPEPVMPVADNEAVRRAKRRSISGQMRRRGRASTILTDSGAGDVLGT